MLPSLPTEIWSQIFEHLCAHCQMPQHSHCIPDFRLREAREGKAALKSLCLVSREFRAMSQDILFHYFSNFSNGGNFNREADRLPSFLRALIANPSLGRQVRIMGLFNFPEMEHHRITRQDLQSWTDLSAKYHILVPDEVNGALLQKRRKGSILFFKKPGPGAQLQQHSREEYSEAPAALYRWLHILALNLVPRITHLQLTSPLGSFEDLQSPVPTFTQLRVLTYDYFEEAKQVLESQIHFPNVSSLCAGQNTGEEWRPIRYPIPTSNIRRLSVLGPPGVLSVLLRFCPNLEDLECHAQPHSGPPEPVNSLVWPTHTKNSLRRLAWSNKDAFKNLIENNVDGAYTAPLLDFKRLEILEIDQPSVLLYSKLLKAEGLSSVLPESLRILHIAFSREVLSLLQIGDQLRGLADAKATSFPKLSIVKVDDSLEPLSDEEETLSEYMNATGVVSRLEQAGIHLKFGEDAPPEYDWYDGSSSRTMLSPPTGIAERDSGTEFQYEVFCLDDLELL